MASTKLIVLKSKELIYTAILLALIIVFVIIIYNMFKDKNGSGDDSVSTMTQTTLTGAADGSELRYTPGTYTSSLSIGDNTLSVMVTVDEYYITDVSFRQLDEAVTTMYPLLETSLEDINTQLHYISSVDDIVLPEDSSYTTMLIVDAIKEALADAVVQ